MFRLCQRLRHSLPFVPMALSTLDTLEQRMEAAQLTDITTATSAATAAAACTIGGSDRADLLRWFTPQCASPFFISPKHDGVRLVSYVPASDAPAPNRKRTTTTAPSADAAAPPTMTCYSRYGRPIYGLFWIEEELRLLRALCGDARLIVDGELYLHHTDMEGKAAAAAAASTPAPPTATKQKSMKAVEAVPSPAVADASAPQATSAQNFKTGFLAVSALVHRLRGSSSQCATAEDVLRYVPALPHLCIFDVPSYSPCPHPLDSGAALSSSGAAVAAVLQEAPLRTTERRAVASEVQRVRHAVMADLNIHDVEQLRVVPNVTPFSQRLRTLTFLLHLLETAVASELLMRHFCPSSAALRSAAPAAHVVAKTTAAKSRRSRRRTADGGNNEEQAQLSSYCGGRYVQRIPYELAVSLDDVQRRILPRYLRQHYEGAVIRTPVNPYDFAEKQKGTIASLVAPLLRAEASPSSRRRGGGTGVGIRSSARRLPDTLLLSLSNSKSSSGSDARAHPSPPMMVRAYSNGVPSVEPLAAVTADPLLSEAERDAADAVAIGRAAVQRARRLPRRSETAVKVLAYHDKEYAILRPLLKEPSRNPNTRVLVAIPRASVASLGYPIKPDTDTAAAEDEVETAEVKKQKKAPRKAGRATASAGSDMVVFYGLQCLSESGLAFNVTMPKLSLSQQKALLDHLLSAGRRAASPPSWSPSARSGASGRRKRKAPAMASLTGLYATVKYSSLTEHGLPRFGTVKAIRGGKGWFM